MTHLQAFLWPYVQVHSDYSCKCQREEARQAKGASVGKGSSQTQLSREPSKEGLEKATLSRPWFHGPPAVLLVRGGPPRASVWILKHGHTVLTPGGYSAENKAVHRPLEC